MTRRATNTTIRPGSLPAASQAFLVDQLKPAEIGTLQATGTKAFARVIGRTFQKKFRLQVTPAVQFFLVSLDLGPGRVRHTEAPSVLRKGLPLQSRSPLKRLPLLQPNNSFPASAAFV